MYTDRPRFNRSNVVMEHDVERAIPDFKRDKISSHMVVSKRMFDAVTHLNGFFMSVGGYFIRAINLPRFWFYWAHFIDYQVSTSYIGSMNKLTPSSIRHTPSIS